MSTADLAAKLGVTVEEIDEALTHLERDHGWDAPTAIAKLAAANPTPDYLRRSLVSWRVSAGPS